MTKSEPLLAKLIDNLQGNHFCLIYGHDLADHSDVIDTIIARKTVAVANRLTECLRDEQAKQEVRDILDHHLQLFTDQGVVLHKSKASSD